VLLFGHSFGGYTTLAAGGASVDASVFTPGCEDAPEEPDCALLADPAIVDELSRGLLDPRIDAIAPQAPALYLGFGDAALAAVTLPTLLMSAGRDRTTPDANEARPIWQAMGDGADRWIRIPDGGHYSFISVCDDVGLDVIEMFEPGASADGCGPDFTPTLETVPVLASYLLAFGRAEVLGEEALRGVLDLSLHPGFEVQTP
jgi:predicted dienelactone hydrolase